MRLRPLAPWTIAIALATVTALAPAVSSSASASTPAPAPAPAATHVTRTGVGNGSLAVSWSAVTGVDHYSVAIFDGLTDVVHAIPAGITSALFAATGACAHFRVTVSAVMPDGSAGASAPVLVGSLAPGGIAKVRATRTDSGTAGAVSWSSPASVSAAATGYRVVLTQISGGVVVANRVSAATTQVFSALNPARTYIAKVTPYNSFGSCATGTIVLGNQIPTAPGALAVTRAAGAPGTALLTWGAPAWAGYGPITSYLVGYGATATPTAWVRATSPSAALALDPTRSWVFRVRTVNGASISSMGAALTLAPLGAAGTPAVDPSATVSPTATGAVVRFTAPLHSSTTYPYVTVAISPTLSGGTFHESHRVNNGAGSVEFTDVPCGVYTVTATGSGAGVAKEFVRSIIDRCGTGAMASSDWWLVNGQATFTDSRVSLPYGFVLSTRPRSGQDVVVTTDATFTSGMGYGVLVHASANSTGGVSAFSVQYDHGWGDYFLLRQWQDGNECSAPLAYTKFPAGLSLTATHHLVVVTSGDSLNMTADGVTVFTVPSLSKAAASTNCHYPVPTGTGIGFRSWGSAGNVTFDHTTLN